MAYFGERNVLPEPNADDAPFWANCAARRLTFQQCAACGRVTHPPIGACPACQSFERTSIDAPADARVFSFTWVHTAAHESVAQALPYNVVVVEFPALPGVRLISNVADVAHGDIRIGDPLTLAWDPVSDAMSLPRFRKRAASSALSTPGAHEPGQRESHQP
jgi:uncharacterized OB-fold protein